MRTLCTILFSLVFYSHGYAQADAGQYISSAEKLYLYKYFRDEEIPARPYLEEIYDDKPSYISIVESPFHDNIFKSFDEKTDYQARFSKWVDDCLEKLHADNSTMHPHGCDSLFSSRNDEEIGNVPVYSILRHDSLGSFYVYLYKDGMFEDRRVGYWIAVSRDGGKQWEHCYTGLTAGVDYFIKPKALVPFIKNDSTLQVEIAFIYGERSLWKDDMIMQMDLRKLMLDRDNDGITDVEEVKYNTNPLSADTDNDGMSDLDDCNPRYKNIDGKYSSLYRHLLEGSGRDSIVYFRPKKAPKLRTLKFISNAPNIVLTEDSVCMHLTGAERTYLIMNWNEYLAYRKKVRSPLATTQISPLFPINNMPNHYRVRIIERNSDAYYLVIEKKDRWIVTRLDD